MEEVKHTPGPWSMWTSCSFRRISSEATGRDGDVLHAVVQHSDGHPDLHFPNGGFNGPDARLILAAPEMFELLLAELEWQFNPSAEVQSERYQRIASVVAKVTGDK